MSWSHHLLATGSRDRSILLRDVRSADQCQRLTGHRSEVRGRVGGWVWVGGWVGGGGWAGGWGSWTHACLDGECVHVFLHAFGRGQGSRHGPFLLHPNMGIIM
jgi:hypothetical protein